MAKIDYSSLRYLPKVYTTLMQKRVSKILLVCSSYDAYIIEEDGRIDEQIFNEYVSLNLRYPPYFVIVHSSKAAFKVLKKGGIDLVISMLSIRGMDLFDFANAVKKDYSDIPLVILTPFSRDISMRLQHENLNEIDYIFSWLGDADIMLAIIKQIEDLQNAEHDIEKGVQYILLVEDSVRYYSSLLSIMYRVVFKHTKDLESGTLNDHQKMLRKRGRPKILLARNYETAINFFDKFQNNLLGIISDVGFPINGKRNSNAGIQFAEYVLKHKPYTPIMLHSAEIENRTKADKLNVVFFDKNSPKFLHQLRHFMKKYLAFGDFIFYNPNNHTELLSVADLKELQHAIYSVPDTSLRYHSMRNHISKWLKARAIFGLGNFFEQYSVDIDTDLDKVREFMCQTIDKYRKQESTGLIAQFKANEYDKYVRFARIGEAMIGGKARGLAFVNQIIEKYNVLSDFENIEISVPQTVVLSTSVFDTFMDKNNLFEFALSNVDDNEILHKFIASEFPIEYKNDIYKFITELNKPIAVRSSSLLEDSQYQPFAGVYATYMIPCGECAEDTLEMVMKAIKAVYASVYFKESKAYMLATHNVIDEEKMGVVLQEICGSAYGDNYYPIMSGVARSINFYPIASEKTEDGIVDLAFGLGKQIVDGGQTLHFSPGAYDKILQLSNPQTALQQSQKYFYAIDLAQTNFEPLTDDSSNLKKLAVSNADNDGTLDFVSSVYDFSTGTLNDGTFFKGKKILTFNNILKYDKIALVDVLKTILRIGKREIGSPIEIEFAVNFDFKKSKTVNFNLLQIRPIVTTSEIITEDLSKIDNNKLIIKSFDAMGNGIINNVCDFIYIKPDVFDSINNPKIAEIISKLNSKFIEKQKNYFLIGPGRWGSSDRWLGVPVKWSQISAARIITEAGLANYRIEPSQGTHFFHNLTSFSVGYLNINPFLNDGFYNLEFLNKQKAEYDDEFVRHIKFEKPIVAKIDGKKRMAVIYKP